MQVEANMVYDHKENGKMYTVIGKGKMLDDSHWVHSVIYCEYGHPEATFTRTLPSFEAKFEISKQY